MDGEVVGGLDGEWVGEDLGGDGDVPPMCGGKAGLLVAGEMEGGEIGAPLGDDVGELQRHLLGLAAAYSVLMLLKEVIAWAALRDAMIASDNCLPVAGVGSCTTCRSTSKGAGQVLPGKAKAVFGGLMVTTNLSWP